jgi:hypothetical protein
MTIVRAVAAAAGVAVVLAVPPALASDVGDSDSPSPPPRERGYCEDEVARVYGCRWVEYPPGYVDEFGESPPGQCESYNVEHCEEGTVEQYTYRGPPLRDAEDSAACWDKCQELCEDLDAENDNIGVPPADCPGIFFTNMLVTEM